MVNPVIPVVEVTMRFPSSDDILLSRDETLGDAPQVGTPDAFTDNTSPCVELIASFDKLPAEDAYNMSPFVKFVVIPFVFVMMTF